MALPDLPKGCWALRVLREQPSTGGSSFMHAPKIGDIVRASAPINNFWPAYRKQGASTEAPMAVQLYAPFMSPYEFYEQSGIRIWPNGHGHTGVSNSIHSNYSDVDGYLDQMIAAHGDARAHEILAQVRHNTVYFPNVMVKGAVQILRNLIPVAVDKTLVESWVFRLVGAPDKLYERALMCNRFINAPTSIVGHDDLEMYECAQEGLRSNGNQWVILRRLFVTRRVPPTSTLKRAAARWNASRGVLRTNCSDQAIPSRSSSNALT